MKEKLYLLNKVMTKCRKTVQIGRRLKFNISIQVNIHNLKDTENNGQGSWGFLCRPQRKALNDTVVQQLVRIWYLEYRGSGNFNWT